MFIKKQLFSLKTISGRQSRIPFQIVLLNRIEHKLIMPHLVEAYRHASTRKLSECSRKHWISAKCESRSNSFTVSTEFMHAVRYRVRNTHVPSPHTISQMYRSTYGLCVRQRFSPLVYRSHKSEYTHLFTVTIKMDADCVV